MVREDTKRDDEHDDWTCEDLLARRRFNPVAVGAHPPDLVVFDFHGVEGAVRFRGQVCRRIGRRALSWQKRCLCDSRIVLFEVASWLLVRVSLL